MNAKPKKESQTKRMRFWAPFATLLLVATVVAGTGTSLEVSSQNEQQEDAGVACTIPGPIRSDGEAGDGGTFMTCNMGPQVLNTYSVSYRYCYLGDTNGRPASITTQTSTVGSGAFTPVNTRSFTTPYTGNGGCTEGSVSSYAACSFTFAAVAVDEIRIVYQNGDWKISIANIVVSSTLL